MDRWLAEQEIECPFCGECITLLIDASSGSQSYIEDCQVCCRPIEVAVSADGGTLDSVEVRDGG